MAEGDIIVIDMSRWPEECQLCYQWSYMGHCVPFYEEPVHQEIGSKMPNGDEVGGMTCCKACHDKHYEIAASAENG